LLLLTLAGCGEQPDLPPAPVRGKVLFRGVPLPGGVIVFTPDEDFRGRGPQATGLIGSDGRFTLTTAKVTGAVPGKYRVTVAGPDGWPLPSKFLDPQLSGLRAEVLTGRQNDFDFQLEER
jgi:hypothetical protein